MAIATSGLIWGGRILCDCDCRAELDLCTVADDEGKDGVVGELLAECECEELGEYVLVVITVICS